jgi:nucleoside-triphosphatase THEP1
MQKRKIILISGDRGAGKTMLCIALKNALSDLGKSHAGVISPGLYQAGKRIGILAEDILSGERRSIADYAPGWDKKNPERVWQFDFKAINWLNERLKNIPDAEILIFDELGYLEFEENRGWTAAFEKLDAGRYRCAFVVVRPELIDKALSRWPDASVQNIDANMDTANLVESMLNQLNESE